jgi:hypothetical protein
MRNQVAFLTKIHYNLIENFLICKCKSYHLVFGENVPRNLPVDSLLLYVLAVRRKT